MKSQLKLVTTTLGTHAARAAEHAIGQMSTATTSAPTCDDADDAGGGKQTLDAR